MNYKLLNIANFLVTFTCFVSIYYCHKNIFDGANNTIFINAFGAVVLVFSNKKYTYSYKKAFLSSITAALLGVIISSTLSIVIKTALAICICILIMALINLKYPPAGAIVLIPLSPNLQIQNLGYFFTIYPTITGLTIIHIFLSIK